MTDRTSLYRISVMGAPQDFSALSAQPHIASEGSDSSHYRTDGILLSWPAWAYAAIAFVGLAVAVLAVLI
jgi:hypothetical protein